jgi:hypothetical protein
VPGSAGLPGLAAHFYRQAVEEHNHEVASAAALLAIIERAAAPNLLLAEEYLCTRQRQRR